MSRARILADYVSSGVTAAEFDFLDTTSGTPDSGTFLRGDKTWVAAGSTSASDLDSGTLAVARMAAGTVIKTTTFMQNFTSHYYYTLATSAAVITFNSVAMQITGLSATEGNKLLIWASAGDLRHVNDATYQSSLGFIIDGTFYSSHGNWYNVSLITWPTTSLMVFTVPASFTSKTISYAGFRETGGGGTHSMMARGGLTGGYTTSIIIQEIAV